MKNWYRVGKIVNTHGIHGEIRVVPITDFPELRFVKGEKVYAFFNEKEETRTELIIQSVRQHKQFYLLTFAGFDNINLVEHFKGATLKVAEDQLQALDDNEFYYHEIIGCLAVSDDGQELGTITDIYTPGANDVWAIRQADGKEILVPYIADVVKEINILEKKVVIHVIEGLLD